MSVSVVKIVGPSYCGSTALGCAMNTGEGFFFGSEIYRQLKKFREEAKDGRFSSCDFCGPSCEYWSSDLHATLRNLEVDSLAEVYELLAARHPEITVIVDGSKSTPLPDENPDFIVVPTKHPVRLLASHIYNRRTRFGIDSEQLNVVGQLLEESWDEHQRTVARAANGFLKSYRDIFALCAEAHVFRSDEAHKDGFQAFRELEEYLGVSRGTFDPESFSRVPSHTIGGNRVPIWLTKNASGQSIPNNPRFEYYSSSSSLGDWKLDDKFEHVFRPPTLDAISSLPAYQALCELLDYDARPPAHSRSIPS